MKKLLFIICLALIGCSTESEPEEPEVVEYKYFATLIAECGGDTNTFKVEIPEYTYESFTKKDLPNCEQEYMLPKIEDGIVRGWNTGYVLAISTEDPKYSQ